MVLMSGVSAGGLIVPGRTPCRSPADMALALCRRDLSRVGYSEDPNTSHSRKSLRKNVPVPSAMS